MKAALFGGTFNPIHIGHLAIAEEVLKSTDYECVLFIPAYMPPHKVVTDPGAEIRLSMLKQSIAHFPNFRVDTCELTRQGFSYSIDTVTHLVSTKTIDPNPGLIIGDDLIEGFFSWKKAEELLKVCLPIVVRRNPGPIKPVPFAHLFIDTPIIPISSSLIRSRIATKGAWRYMVPEPARHSIEILQLYGFSKN